jgi:hypothetical protein
MTPITLSEEIINPIKASMEIGGAITLPFSVPYIWVINGDPKLKSLGGVLYFGGWASNRDDMDAVLKERATDLPTGFVPVELTAMDSKDVPVYTTRHVIFAPIATRRAWVKDKVRAAEYIEGSRQHVQMIAYMAERKGSKDQTEYIPWGPIVLSAKGFQAQNLLNAVGAWEKHTQSIRRDIAPGIPAYFFYLALGTFGSEIKQKMVGGGSSQSAITPIEPYLPEKLTEELMTKLFVGETIAAVMVDLQVQAKEWLTAWKTVSVDSLGGSHIPAQPEIPENFEDQPF